MHKVGVIGTGFVGTAVSTGFELLGTNIEVREYDKYKPTESLYDVVNNSDILFLCLPTPMNDDGSCNTSIVEEVCLDILNVAESRKSLVLKSTVPPGTTERISEDVLKGKHGIMFNPEFLTEKNAFKDFLEQDRIFLGPAKGCTDDDVVRVMDLYEDFSRKQKEPAEIYEVDSAEIAEMIKYGTNCFLATKVIFFNELYEICEASDINFNHVVGMMLLDKRIGKSHSHVPGPDGNKGFGLSCFPKDLNALMAFAKEHDVDPMVLETVWTKNLLVRENYDWEDLAQVNGDYSNNE